MTGLIMGRLISQRQKSECILSQTGGHGSIKLKTVTLVFCMQIGLKTVKNRKAY